MDPTLSSLTWGVTMDVGEFVAHPYATFLGRWVLAIVLLAAAISKLSDRRRFAETIQEFRVLPASASSALALTLPWLEAALGTALAIGLWTRIAATTALVLIAAFSVAIAINLVRGRTAECNCFGPLYRGRIGGWSLVRNTLLMACAIWVLRAYDGYLSLDAWLFDRRQQDAPAVEGLVPLVFTALLLGLGALLVHQFVLVSRSVKLPTDQEYRR